MKAINDLSRHFEPMRAQLEAAVSRVLASGWFVLGQEVKCFENAFAAYCGVANCVSVANGTDALELALRAVGVGPGSTVATVANAGMYSSVAIRAVGARAVFIDIAEDTMLMDEALLAQQLKAQRIDAVIATHLFGLMNDMGAVASLCRDHGAALIEDCAQSHGAMWQGGRAGSFGDAACFSFYPTKNLGAIGDGGAVVCRDPALADRLRTLRQYGWTSKYTSTVPGGRNSRLDELQAAVLSAQLPYLDAWNARRREIAVRYSTLIKHSDVLCPAVAVASGPGYVAHLYVVRCADREGLRRHLAAHHVPHDVHYPIPDYHQASLADWGFGRLDLPVTELACRTVLTLPCFPEMTDAEVGEVTAIVNQW